MSKAQPRNPLHGITLEFMLNELVAELREQGVALTFARVKRPLQDILERSGIVDAVGADHIHVSLRSAVSDYLRGNPGAGPAVPG